MRINAPTSGSLHAVGKYSGRYIIITRLLPAEQHFRSILLDVFVLTPGQGIACDGLKIEIGDDSQDIHGRSSQFLTAYDSIPFSIIPGEF